MKVLTKQHRGGYFSPDVEPALRVTSGELFRVETASLLTVYPNGNIPSDGITVPVTGPVWVEGARAGCTMRVTVERIELSGKGVVMSLPGTGVLGSEASEFRTKVVTYDERFVYFSGEVRIPVHKVIGKIGTAPRERVRSGIPGPHGGNLDNTHITEGASVYLPIYVDGGLLYVGDLHAAQGDGEPFGGVESEGEVVLRAEVRDDLQITDPVVVTPDAVVTCSAAPTLEDAVRAATRNAIVLLSQELGLSHTEACMVCSIGCDIRLSQVTNPLNGAKVVIPRTLLSTARWV